MQETLETNQEAPSDVQILDENMEQVSQETQESQDIQQQDHSTIEQLGNTRERSISNGSFRARSTSAASKPINNLESSRPNQETMIRNRFVDLFSTVSESIQSHMQQHLNELKFQEQVNNLATEEFQNVLDSLEEEYTNIMLMKTEFAALEPFLKDVDEVEAEIFELGKTIRILDAYTRKLEQQLKPFL